jgi:DNA-binding response OmpR family regulator
MHAMFPARILIIEDGAVLAENLKTFLGRRATDIRIALDAETAMEILQSFAPDLRVLD